MRSMHRRVVLANPQSLFKTVDHLLAEVDEGRLELRVLQSADRVHSLCAMIDGELLGLGQAVGLEHVVEGLLHVSLLAEPAGNQHIQLWIFTGSEENGRGGETQLEVSGRRLTEHVSGGHKVEEVVHQLEGDAEVLAVLEGVLHVLIAASRQHHARLAAVGNEAGRLVVALVEVVLEPFRLVILIFRRVLKLHEFSLHQIRQHLGEYLDDVRVVNAGHDLGADPEDVVPGHGGPSAVPPDVDAGLAPPGLCVVQNVVVHQGSSVDHLTDLCNLALVLKRFSVQTVGVNVERVGDAERDEGPEVLALAVEIVLGHLIQLTHPVETLMEVGVDIVGEPGHGGRQQREGVLLVPLVPTHYALTGGLEVGLRGCLQGSLANTPDRGRRGRGDNPLTEPPNTLHFFSLVEVNQAI